MLRFFPWTGSWSPYSSRASRFGISSWRVMTVTPWARKGIQQLPLPFHKITDSVLHTLKARWQGNAICIRKKHFSAWNGIKSLAIYSELRCFFFFCLWTSLNGHWDKLLLVADCLFRNTATLYFVTATVISCSATVRRGKKTPCAFCSSLNSIIPHKFANVDWRYLNVQNPDFLIHLTAITVSPGPKPSSLNPCKPWSWSWSIWVVTLFEAFHSPDCGA